MSHAGAGIGTSDPVTSVVILNACFLSLGHISSFSGSQAGNSKKPVGLPWGLADQVIGVDQGRAQ